MSISTFILQIGLKDTFFHVSKSSLGLYLSPECLLNFLSNLYILPWLGKNFKFMVFTFLENALNLAKFTNVSLPSQNSPQVLIITPARQRKLTHSPWATFFPKICFSQQHKYVEKTMICLIKIQSEKMKMT